MRGDRFNHQQDRTLMEGYADNVDMLLTEIEIHHRLAAEYHEEE